MSSATGIRLSTARWKDLGTYHLILPPEQHYVKYRHNGKHSGSDVAQLKKVHVHCQETSAESKNRLLD